MLSSSQGKNFRWEGIRYLKIQYNWRGYGGGRGARGYSWGLLQAVCGPAWWWWVSCPCYPLLNSGSASELTWKPQGWRPREPGPHFLLREMRGPAGRGVCLFSSLWRQVQEKSSFLRITTKNSGRGRAQITDIPETQGGWRFLEKRHQPQTPRPTQ